MSVASGGFVAVHTVSHQLRLIAGRLLARQSYPNLAIFMVAVMLLGTVGGSSGHLGPAAARGEILSPMRLMPTGLMGNRCGACHSIDPVMSHPVAVMPTMRVPADLPLESGRITCLTCHEADAASHTTASRNHAPLLRRQATGPELCVACHAKEASTSAKSMHALALGKAHMTKKADSGGSQGLSWGRVDGESQNCLSCHDGMMASDASLGSGGVRGAHGKDHPVGVAYRNSSKSMGVMPLAPASMLNSRIRLFNQTVGCGSCHSLYSQEDRHLVMSNLRSKLCLSCHQDR
jgi:hypothetical protein